MFLLDGTLYVGVSKVLIGKFLCHFPKRSYEVEVILDNERKIENIRILGSGDFPYTLQNGNKTQLDVFLWADYVEAHKASPTSIFLAAKTWNYII